jgi:hypothetical protein
VLTAPVRSKRCRNAPAWGEYVRAPVAGSLHLVGLLVIRTRGDRVEDITHFDTATAFRLGLPRTLD